MTELYKRDGRSLFSTFNKITTVNKLNTEMKSFFNVPYTEPIKPIQPDIKNIVTDESLKFRNIPTDEASLLLKEDMKYFKSQRFFGRKKKTFKI